MDIPLLDLPTNTMEGQLRVYFTYTFSPVFPPEA